MEIKAVIFDLDGTLVDSLEDIANACNEVLESEGLPVHSIKSYQNMIGHGTRHLIQEALPEASKSRTDEILELYEAHYEENLLIKSKPYGGMVKILEALAAQGLPMSVLSNKPHDMTTHIVKELFGKIPFHKVVGQRRGKPQKPDPQVAVEIASAMDVAVERCALVGDTPVDILTARNANMQAIAITWGFRSHDELAELEPDKLIHAPYALLSHFDDKTA
ncbi:MAG: HAD family hydrolase [Deltaproteobacteria bacterium]|jgi:phosphoglycolate phosphatase|nr:HAD family hydrolase [Deltaproteobacteria bacterium]MBT6432742.1 HAD family hydrolase [Deltaproteobacteria bacterium]MBT6492714.1 HAD family hydrolase [Deltaproteobacteria bacterium]